MTNTGGTPAGWYHAPGDPEGTQRYWDGAQWVGEPQQPDAAPEAPQSSPPPAYQPPPSGAPGGGTGAPPPGSQTPPGYTAYGTPGAAGGVGQLAEPVQRIVARLIDGLIWIFVGFVLTVVFVGGSLFAGSGDASFVASFFAGIIALALVLAYEVFMTTKTGNTLGKKVFNIKIVQEDGSPVDEQVMLMRMLPYIVTSVIGIIPIIGLIAGLANLGILIVSLVFLFTDDLRQTIWDKVGKTKVVAG